MTAPASYDGRSKIRLAVTFYSACVALALVWSWIIDRPFLVFDPTHSTWYSAGIGALTGLGCGLGTVWLSRLFLQRFSWAQELYVWFSSILGPFSRRDALILAALSSIGEELLFRGPVLHTLGLYLSTAVFALLHFPPQLKFWPWTAMAAVLGLIFGQMALWTGNLAGPIIAHFVVNGLNLMEVTKLSEAKLSEDEKLLQSVPESSMDHHAPNPSCSDLSDNLLLGSKPGSPINRKRQ